MGRILAGLAMIVFVGALAAGATGAFFSDTETSTGNTFTAGALDLKVDSEAHYNGLVCTLGDDEEYTWQVPASVVDEEVIGELEALDHFDQSCNGTWAQTDLGAENIFLDFDDVKPGDEGENTISLHVLNNDAWGRFIVGDVESLDNTCTEPEGEAEMLNPDGSPSANPGCSDVGELHQNITFSAWLDQGTTPGFQCNGVAGCQLDPEEGDNVWQGQELEPVVIQPGTVNLATTTYDIWPALAAVRASTLACAAAAVNGNTNYGTCHGLAVDGRMVGSATYYFGLEWSVPDTVGNEAQTDSLNATLEFQVEQHRNNPTPFTP